MPHIYKIVSPKNKIYVGSTTNIEKRIKKYRQYDCKGQKKLYSSLKKYGFDKHKISIITECTIENMFKLESYYGQLYNCIGINGLNLRLPSMDDKYTPMDEDVKFRISNSQKGLNSKRLGKKPWNKGLTFKDKENYDPKKYATRTGYKYTEEEKLKRSISIKKVRSTLESRNKTSEASKGGKNPNSKKIIEIKTGRIINSLKELSVELNVNQHSLGHYLRGRFKNNTGFKYL
jgi:group I intron endonuclease